ncbi:MAG: glycosyltransferase [Paludibacteraceae bacterium]
MNKAELTLIIPFLNEGKEVYETVKSFKQTADVNIDVILINDASNDGYNYKIIADEFSAVYIEHQIRQGVAVSRDEGVSVCKTMYFLILDAHMRVTQSNWASSILNAIKSNDRTVICCCTVALNENREFECSFIGYGSSFDFSNLGINWIAKKMFDDESMIEIPCVLGASYICSKNYWEYLKGLSGLIDYGLDEQLISLKVWLEGGSCHLLTGVTFGHLFRSGMEVPYSIKSVPFSYNKFLIAELFLEQNHKIQIYNSERNINGFEICNQAMDILINKKESIFYQKEYYKTIFTRDIHFLINMNETFL